ncbi:guanylate kinase [Winogradskyella aurantia]|uniref:Guanylate kinase n=1 Tax=Winogradskyella aurantia TaxID=1915063 RepID=A0A265UZF6_9FLAO|nr:guanylate kinase [Winogradskyella aurantia]
MFFKYPYKLFSVAKETTKKQGKLIVFSAPSGSGKTTIVKHLLKQPELNLEFSISATSREARGKEIDGKDYYFLSLKEFKNKINNDEFLEWEEVYRDNFYGTLKSEVERIWAQGKHVIFDIDVSGGLRIKRKFPEQTLAIFVKPPDLNELVRRLKDRGEESPEKISMRVAKAPAELATAPLFDVIVVNANLKDALQNAHDLVARFIAEK